MKHRHLTGISPWSSAAIDDILDRGRPEDWIALREEVDRDPYGAVAQAVKRLSEATPRYGTSPLWSSYVDEARARARTAGRR